MCLFFLAESRFVVRGLQVEARHRDIKRLENNIRELHDMWMDMAMIVEKQGDMVDRIEFNVGQARDYTEVRFSEIRCCRLH